MASAEKSGAFEKNDGVAVQNLVSFSSPQDNVACLSAKNKTVADLSALGFTAADVLLGQDDPLPPEAPATTTGPVVHKTDEGKLTEIDLPQDRRLLVNADGNYYFADASSDPKTNGKDSYPVIPAANVSISDNGDVTILNLGKYDYVTYTADGREVEHFLSSTRTWNPLDGTSTTVSDHVEGKPDITDTEFANGSHSHRVENTDGSSTTKLEQADGSYTITTITAEGHVLTFDKSSQGSCVLKRDGQIVERAEPTGNGNATVAVRQADGLLLIYDDVDITNIRPDGSVIDNAGRNLLVNGHPYIPHYEHYFYG